MRSQIVAGGAAVLLLTARMVSAAGPVMGPILNTANGHNYYLLGPDTWTGDEASAQALGGTLATVRNSQENAWIYSEFMPTANNNLWIGFTDPSHDTVGGSTHAANFVWASGEHSTYRNWAAGEPSNNGGNEWYTLLQYQTYNLVQPLQWNDVQNVQGTTYGVAEVAPEPTSIGIIGLAAGMLLCRRRGV
ncbi:MAG: Lectin C-type domain protein [Phycisphaerales bacterium]|nr:Lectin C-type domain protein [Phycisphaerales bacterium]